MEKWAAIDIGSNTVQLLVVEREDAHFRPPLTDSVIKPGNTKNPLFSALRTTRLGASSKPGLLKKKRIEETVEALKEYHSLLSSLGVEKVRVIATSAVRDAANAQLLLQAVRDSCGWQIEILSGQEEARFSFFGAAASALAYGMNHIIVLDIGGNSSELIRWRKNRLSTISANVGAVRAHVAGWQINEIIEALAFIDREEDDDKAELIIGVGGTITTAAALIMGCQEYDRKTVEGYCLKIEEVEELITILQPLTIAERCAFSPLLERRGEIICEGLLILVVFYRLLSLTELKVSAGGVLEGCLWDLYQRGSFPRNEINHL
ncbi:MAG: hypothetical protein FWG61_09930 [Firmicutes bacterium]|nr:hypothetical protein [Bacillota bacterium]